MKDAVIFLDPRGTAWEVVRAAHDRGFEVMALVSDPSILAGVAAAYCEAVPYVSHRVSIKDWTDHAELVGVLKGLQQRASIKGVYYSSDPCAAPASVLRKALGLPTTPASIFELVTDKYRLRRALREKTLSSLRNMSAEEVAGLRNWPFPGFAYFKPRHGVFSAFVKRCQSLDDIRVAKDELLGKASSVPRWVEAYLSRDGSAFHIEEAIEGELLSVEGICIGGGFQSLGLLSRILYSKDAVVEMGSVFPYPHPLRKKVEQVVGDAHRALGITEGPTHTEVIVDAQGRVEIIDLNPRFVGADVLQSINFATEGRIQETLLDWAIGAAPRIENNVFAFSCLQYILPPAAMTIESLSFPTEPEVRFTAKFFQPGQTVSHTDRQIDYLGCYLTVMPTFESALSRSRELRSRVWINGNQEGAY